MTLKFVVAIFMQWHGQILQPKQKWWNIGIGILPHTGDVSIGRACHSKTSKIDKKNSLRSSSPLTSSNKINSLMMPDDKCHVHWPGQEQLAPASLGPRSSHSDQPGRQEACEEVCKKTLGPWLFITYRNYLTLLTHQKINRLIRF